MKFGYTPAISVVEILFCRIPVIPDESFTTAVGSGAPFRGEAALFSIIK